MHIVLRGLEMTPNRLKKKGEKKQQATFTTTKKEIKKIILNRRVSVIWPLRRLGIPFKSLMTTL